MDTEVVTTAATVIRWCCAVCEEEKKGFLVFPKDALDLSFF